MLFVVLWVGATAYFQYRSDRTVRACLARYCADPQGITYLPRVKSGPLILSLWNVSYSFASVAFKLDLGHQKMMAAFAPWLYHTLYLEPAKFFAEAVSVEGAPCFFSEKAPNVLVAKGDVIPSEEECARMLNQLQSYRKAHAGPKYIPRRFLFMFPQTDDTRQSFPSSRYVFTAKDGNRYTIFSGEPEKWRAVEVKP